MAANYYVFNKAQDYRRGFLWHMQCEDEGVRLEDGCSYGVFISRLLDGMEEGLVWHRMTLQLLSDHELPFSISFYTCDEDLLLVDGVPKPISQLIGLSEQALSMDEKKALFLPMKKYTVSGSTDLLLHQVRGRYMWFMADFYGAADGPVGIRHMMVYFPEQSWLSYLPAVYDRRSEGDTFLGRFLAIFQSMYDDLGREIEAIPRYLDPEAAHKETLMWLAGWLGIHHVQLWSESALRYLVSHGAELYGMRGTKQGIAQFVRLYTGELPLIAEQHQIEAYSGDPLQYRLLEQLYGTDPNVFTIFVRAACLPTPREFSDLRRIIEDVKPAHMEFKLVTLRPYILLDSYSYLGINSVLSQYRSLELNGFSMLSFSALNK